MFGIFNRFSRESGTPAPDNSGPDKEKESIRDLAILKLLHEKLRENSSIPTADDKTLGIISNRIAEILDLHGAEPIFKEYLAEVEKENELEKREDEPSRRLRELKFLYDLSNRYKLTAFDEGGKEVSFGDSEEGRRIKDRRKEIWRLYGEEPIFKEYLMELEGEAQADRVKTERFLSRIFKDKDQSKISKYCEILGVLPTASPAEILAAYRKKAKETHPDHNPGNEEAAAERFKMVKAAYDYLKE